MTYEQYEEQAKQERENNREIIQLFRKWLAETGLKEKTINKHVDNIVFYIDEFLLYEEVIPAKEGITSVNGYFNWFFPRKAMWSSVASTKETVASLKKFYKCLMEAGLVDEADCESFSMPLVACLLPSAVLVPSFRVDSAN